jgi:hypothetical protein
MQRRHEDLRFSDQCHRRGRSRKSLQAMYLYNKNNNISIPHMYSYMSMRTRAYESPGDELRLLRDFPVGHSPLVFGHPAVAPRGPHTGPVSRRCVRDRPGSPPRRETPLPATRRPAARLPEWQANRYFRPKIGSRPQWEQTQTIAEFVFLVGDGWRHDCVQASGPKLAAVHGWPGRFLQIATRK